MSMTRRDFIGGTGALCALGGCAALRRGNAYSVAILGDTHYDAEPESVYHSHYDESNRWAKVQHAEFRRNGEMWRERCPKLLAASARLAHEKDTAFILQTGDIIQGDCDDVATHKKMMDDCIRMLRAPYPAKVPFLTVVGNHDFRGKGAVEAYFSFAEQFLAKELGREVHYPAFSFRRGPDLWVFCHFEKKVLMDVVRLIEQDPDARHVFLVTHGPFTCADTNSPRWRLGGSPKLADSRKALYETLSRRHAIVISGHTHTVAYYRHENALGGFTEFTCNSVWAKDELATAKPVSEGAAQYGAKTLARLTGAARADYESDLALFRPGMKDYFFNYGAGHFRLDVGEDEVAMAFYPGDALVPARTWRALV